MLEQLRKLMEPQVKIDDVWAKELESLGVASEPDSADIYLSLHDVNTTVATIPIDFIAYYADGDLLQIIMIVTIQDDQTNIRFNLLKIHDAEAETAIEIHGDELLWASFDMSPVGYILSITVEGDSNELVDLGA